MTRKNLAILLFNDVEVLDFAGPFEVFSVTDELSNNQLLNVYTVSKTDRPIRAKNGLKVIPDYGFTDHPAPDYLVIPGGFGTRALLEDEETLQWVTKVSGACENVLSVCSGSLVLARAGLLDGLKATTHHKLFEELEGLAPRTTILTDTRVVDNGKIITSGGISAGIDMSLDFVTRLFGGQTATNTAEYMEYNYQQAPAHW